MTQLISSNSKLNIWIQNITIINKKIKNIITKKELKNR